MSRPGNSFVYSAAQVAGLLGFWVETPAPMSAALPQIEGELLVWYGGWSLADLRASRAGQRLMNQHVWGDRFADAAAPGHYRVLPRVPGSNRKTWDEQVAYLATIDGGQWRLAPVAVVVTALLTHLAAKEQDALQGDWCRCLEQTRAGRQADLTVSLCRLDLRDTCNGVRDENLWLAAALEVAG